MSPVPNPRTNSSAPLLALKQYWRDAEVICSELFFHDICYSYVSCSIIKFQLILIWKQFSSILNTVRTSSTSTHFCEDHTKPPTTQHEDGLDPSCLSRALKPPSAFHNHDDWLTLVIRTSWFQFFWWNWSPFPLADRLINLALKRENPDIEQSGIRGPLLRS